MPRREPQRQREFQFGIICGKKLIFELELEAVSSSRNLSERQRMIASGSGVPCYEELVMENDNQVAVNLENTLLTQ